MVEPAVCIGEILKRYPQLNFVAVFKKLYYQEFILKFKSSPELSNRTSLD